MTSSSDLFSVLFNPNHKFLLVTHREPDLDALGSTLALLEALKSKQITAHFWCADYLPKETQFLPGLNQIITKLPSDFNPTHLVSLDASDISRVKDIDKLGLSGIDIINIDHHADNTQFGTFNYTKRISSVGELISEFFIEHNIPISESMATCLYAAIVFDTGRFLFSNTKESTLKIAASLVEAGADANKIGSTIYENFTQDTFKMIKTAIDNLVINSDLKLGYTFIPRSLSNIPFKTVDFIRQLSELEIILVFQEIGHDLVKINLRSKGDFNVSTFSHQFGGGGHPKASGIVFKGEYTTIRSRILTALENELRSE